MKKLLTTLAIAGSTALLGLPVHAQTNGEQNPNGSVTQPAGNPGSISRGQARDMNNEAKAEYKAQKKVADANKELNKAECETNLDGGTERACKKTAKKAAETDKAAAKTVYKAQKEDIKDQKNGTQPAAQ
jgi:hypothetical protein